MHIYAPVDADWKVCRTPSGGIDTKAERSRCERLIALLPKLTVGEGAKERCIDIFFSWHGDAPLPLPAASVPLPHMLLDHDVWESELDGHHDRLFVALLLDMIRNGCNIAYRGPRSVPVFARNHGSAMNSAEALAFLERDIAVDQSLGRTSPWSTTPPFANFRNSPLGAVPKGSDGKQTGLRRIYDASAGAAGKSLNDQSARIFTPCARFDAFVDRLRRLGPGTLLAKEDVEAAFRIIPVRHEDRPLLGLRLGKRYAYECALPFGLRVSPPLWERVAAGLHWILAEHGFDLTHHVDDFVFLFDATGVCAAEHKRMLALCARLRIPLAVKKRILPCTLLTVTGIDVDTVAMTLSVTPARKQRVIDALTVARDSASLTIAQLQSLVGRLAFIARVFPAGRAFYSRALRAIRTAKHLHCDTVEIDAGIRGDCDFWLSFLPAWKGVEAISLTDWRPSLDVGVFTDACPTGYGVWNASTRQWVSEPWSPEQLQYCSLDNELRSLSIPALELYALVCAATLFGASWRGMRIAFRCDAMAACAAVNRGLSSSLPMSVLLRTLSMMAVTHRFEFRAVHIAGAKNVDADLLSRAHARGALDDGAAQTRGAFRFPRQFSAHSRCRPLHGRTRFSAMPF